jgi:hypothetical protein
MSTLTLTSEALGHKAGDVVTTFSPGEEAWLLSRGYAKKTGYATGTAAVLTGASNAVNIVTGGALVLNVNGVPVSTTLANGDTPAQAATKIDTALGAVADAAITSSKLVVTSIATGQAAEVKVVSGAGTTLANLGLTVGQRANGGDGGVGVANTGSAAETPVQDLTAAANREKAPALAAVGDTGLPDPGPLDPAMTFSTADDDPNDKLVPDFDYDPAGVNNEAPGAFTVAPLSGAAAGGTAVTLTFVGDANGITGVTFGGTAATSVVVVSDTKVTCVTPAHAAGAVAVVATNPVGSKSQAAAYTYV